MRKYRLLDLFCGAGGCSMGYHRAGFEVVGVDINPQPRYPFEFHQADAMTFPLDGFDVIHASPPCQGYTTMNNRWGSDSPLLIAETRKRLAGRTYIIENVCGAKNELINPIRLSGELFGLRVHRPRLFEINPWILSFQLPPRQENPVAVYGKHDQRRLWTRTDGSELRCATLEDALPAMGIDWMEWDELKEAIPPAYTEWIGKQLMEVLT